MSQSLSTRALSAAAATAAATSTTASYTTSSSDIKVSMPEKFESNSKLHAEFMSRLHTTTSQSSSSSADSKSHKRKTKPIKYTPLEQQVMAIKAQYPDVVLFVQVGYKYRVYEEDAKKAAELLDIFCFKLNNCMTASVPVHRLHIHMKRFVEAGYKVGVVNQVETAALKAAGLGKNSKVSGPFERKLVAMYTKATLVADEHSADVSLARPSSHLLCLWEETIDSSEELHSALRVKGHMLAFDSASGDIVWDSFEDGLIRSELETRLYHIQPAEIILPGGATALSTNSERILNVFLARSNDRARVERLDPARFPFDNTKASIVVSNFYSQAGKDAEHSVDLSDDGKNESLAAGGATAVLSSDLCKTVRDLPAGVTVCLGIMIQYLKDFRLDSALRRTQNLQNFVEHTTMTVDGVTLQNLEVLNSVDVEGETASLLWLMRHTRTAFGTRLLKRWICHPLTNRETLQQRLDAVRSFVENDDAPWMRAVQSVLQNMPDLERGLTKIQHSSCKPADFATLILSFKRIVDGLCSMSLQQVNSSLLVSIFENIANSSLRQDVQYYMDALDVSAVQANSLAQLYTDPDTFPDLKQCRANVISEEQQLQSDLADARDVLGHEYRNLQYKKVLSAEYLIEVRKTHMNRVPSSWLLVGGTKQCTRYRSPAVQESLRKLNIARERLELEAKSTWKRFLAGFNDRYTTFRGVVARLAELDCLSSLAIVAQLPGYVQPTICDEHKVVIRNGRHPVLESRLSSPYIGNDVSLCANGEKVMIVTGPNSGGKSSYIRQIALTVLMAQIGSYVPADHVELGVFDAIYTRMGARDNIGEGMSTFLVELSETSNILRRATERSLVILDELGRGTSTHDGMAIAWSTLDFMIREIRCMTLFVTHYPVLGQLASVYPNTVGNYHMDFVAATDEDTGIPRLTFLFKVVKGLCDNSYGVNVARLADMPLELLQRATQQSQWLQHQIEQRQLARLDSLYSRIQSLVCAAAEHDGDEDSDVCDREAITALQREAIAAMAQLCKK
jgi:DNA mismatch repair protein MSH3